MLEPHSFPIHNLRMLQGTVSLLLLTNLCFTMASAYTNYCLFVPSTDQICDTDPPPSDRVLRERQVMPPPATVSAGSSGQSLNNRGVNPSRGQGRGAGRGGGRITGRGQGRGRGRGRGRGTGVGQNSYPPKPH